MGQTAARLQTCHRRSAGDAMSQWVGAFFFFLSKIQQNNVHQLSVAT